MRAPSIWRSTAWMPRRPRSVRPSSKKSGGACHKFDTTNRFARRNCRLSAAIPTVSHGRGSFVLSRATTGEPVMSSIAKYATLAVLLLGVTACGDTWGQRAVTGGGIGAGSVALLGAATGFNPLLGALVGGAGGAAIGAASTPRHY